MIVNDTFHKISLIIGADHLMKAYWSYMINIDRLTYHDPYCLGSKDEITTLLDQNEWLLEVQARGEEEPSVGWGEEMCAALSLPPPSQNVSIKFWNFDQVDWIPQGCRRWGWRSRVEQWLPAPCWCGGRTGWRRWQGRERQRGGRWDNERGWEESLCVLLVEHPADLGVEMMWWGARAVVAEAEENQRPPLLIGINKCQRATILDIKINKHLKDRL